VKRKVEGGLEGRDNAIGQDIAAIRRLESKTRPRAFLKDDVTGRRARSSSRKRSQQKGSLTPGVM